MTAGNFGVRIMMTCETISRMTREELENTSIQDLILAAREGSQYAYNCAIAKMIDAKKYYKPISTVMTQAERDIFWVNMRKWQSELDTIKRLVRLS